MEDNKVSEEIKVTEGGYEYIDVNGLKVRNSIVNHRIKEDNETFEEYYLRRRLSRNALDSKRKVIWYSKNWGTLTRERSYEIYQQMMEFMNQNKKEDGSKNESSGSDSGESKSNG